MKFLFYSRDVRAVEGELVYYSWITGKPYNLSLAKLPFVKSFLQFDTFYGFRSGHRLIYYFFSVVIKFFNFLINDEVL